MYLNCTVPYFSYVNFQYSITPSILQCVPLSYLAVHLSLNCHNTVCLTTLYGLPLSCPTVSLLQCLSLSHPNVSLVTCLPLRQCSYIWAVAFSQSSQLSVSPTPTLYPTHILSVYPILSVSLSTPTVHLLYTVTEQVFFMHSHQFKGPWIDVNADHRYTYSYRAQCEWPFRAVITLA